MLLPGTKKYGSGPKAKGDFISLEGDVVSDTGRQDGHCTCVVKGHAHFEVERDQGEADLAHIGDGCRHGIGSIVYAAIDVSEASF